MTNFSNPYAPIPGDMMMEQKTSVLAIIALVCSLICLLPVIPALGVILAVIALVMIAGSGGKWMLYTGGATGATTVPGGSSDSSVTLPSPPGTTIKIEPGKQPGVNVDVKTDKPAEQPAPPK